MATLMISPTEVGMRMGWLAVVTAAGLMVFADSVVRVAGQASTSGHWPQWRGPQRDGVSPDKGLLAQWPGGGPPKLMTATGLGSGFSSVSIAQGRIFTMG